MEAGSWLALKVMACKTIVPISERLGRGWRDNGDRQQVGVACTGIGVYAQTGVNRRFARARAGNGGGQRASQGRGER